MHAHNVVCRRSGAPGRWLVAIAAAISLFVSAGAGALAAPQTIAFVATVTNTCNGELVEIPVKYTTDYHLSVRKDGGYDLYALIRVSGRNGTGQDTGARYTLRYHNDFHFQVPAAGGFTEAFNVIYRLDATGNVPGVEAHDTLQYKVNPDGSVRVARLKSESVCR